MEFVGRSGSHPASNQFGGVKRAAGGAVRSFAKVASSSQGTYSLPLVDLRRLVFIYYLFGFSIISNVLLSQGLKTKKWDIALFGNIPLFYNF
jgi:hypothetical protein